MDMRSLVFYILLFTANIAAAKVEAVIGLSPTKNPNLPGIMPTTSTNEILISRDQYIISYDIKHRAPNWVAWKLEPNQIGHSGRTNEFFQDPDLENYLLQAHKGVHAVGPDEYKGSCFDRGHQVPSADRSDTKDDNKITFFMSNMIPQTPYLNRVIWEHLEEYTRKLVLQDHKKVYVIAGPIYDEDFGNIGPDNDIPVPSKDFKVIIVLDADQTLNDIGPDTQMISVIMPNILQDGSKPIKDKYSKTCPTEDMSFGGNPDDWKAYVAPVSEIESEAGLKLFSKIPAVRQAN